MCAMLPIADAPNEAKLLALPGKGAFEQSAEWRERDHKLVGEVAGSMVVYHCKGHPGGSATASCGVAMLCHVAACLR